MGWAMLRMAAATSAGELSPATTLATAGCPSGNCSAAAGSGTACASQTSSIAPCLGQNLGRGVRVEIFGAGLRTRDQDARVEGGGDGDGDAACLAQRQQIVERRLFQQRVAARQHEQVEVARLGEAAEDARIVDADADRPDDAGPPQRVEGLVAARHRLGEPLLDRIAMPACG